MSAIASQEYLIEQVQESLAVALAHGYLEEVEVYSNTLHRLTEGYKVLSSQSVSLQLPPKQSTNQTSRQPKNRQSRTNQLEIQRGYQQSNYQNQVPPQAVTQLPPQPPQPPQEIISRYVYADGEDNPKARESSTDGHRFTNNEVNRLHTPANPTFIQPRQQQYSEQDVYGDAWDEDARRNFNGLGE